MTATSAPAKIILFGEHAVVHGQPAIAIPLGSLRARVELIGSAETLELRSPANDLLASLQWPGKSDPRLLDLLRVILEQLDCEAPALSLRLVSDIPPGSGLGSGAAISAALTRAIAAALGIQLNNDRLNDIVFETEKLFHGTPGGIDNTVVVHEQALCFTRGRPAVPVRMARPLRLLVADSGLRCATHIPVSAVREQLRQDPGLTGRRLEEIGRITRKAFEVLSGTRPGSPGPLMNRNHELLRELDVSCPVLDRLVAVALAAGACGAKLSGAGRGGNVIALVNDACESSVTRSLQDAGAVSILATTFPATVKPGSDC